MNQAFEIVFALFPRLTQLDFTGPFEVLSRVPGARVVPASLDGGSLEADSGLVFGGLARLSDIEQCDLICVPGGLGMTAALKDLELIRQVRRLALGARYVTSVCSGSLLLAAAGLLGGKRATCHWAWRELLADAGAMPVAERVVRDGNVITGGGVTAGIDFALVVAAEIAGAELAQAIQLALEYHPAPPFAVGQPELAPPEVLERVQGSISPLVPERRAALNRALAQRDASDPSFH